MQNPKEKRQPNENKNPQCTHNEKNYKKDYPIKLKEPQCKYNVNTM